MWGGDAFRSVWHGATDVAKKSVAAVATGAEKLGAAVVKGVEVAAEKTVDAAKWAAKESVAAAKWVGEKGKQGLELGKKAAAAVGHAALALKDKFVAGAKKAGTYIKCKSLPVIANLAGAVTLPARALGLVPNLSGPKPLSNADAERAKTILETALTPHQAAEFSSMAYEAKPGDVSKDGQYKVDRVMTGTMGYRSIVMSKVDGKPPKKVLAYAGTDPLSPGDLLTDVAQHGGLIPPQYNRALADAQSVKDECEVNGEEMVITGHSLGGGEGNYASAMLGVPAVTVNSAPLGVGAQTMISMAGADPEGTNSVTLATGSDVVSVVAANPLMASHPGAVVPVGSTTGDNPLKDHMMDNFNADNIQLPGYTGPTRNVPATDSGTTGVPSVGMPPID